MDIVREILADSDKGARRLLDEYGGRLTAAAISLCNDEVEAEDLVSETVDIAVRQIGSYRNEAVLF
jgi:DNA-directed RNA polymerase specialized sigma24 family protein